MYRAGIVVTVAALCLTGCALAGPEQCSADFSIKVDVRLAACTAIIESGQGDVVQALINRSIALRGKNDYVRSLADLDQAVVRAPNSSLAFYARAVTRVYKAELDAAAHRLDPADFDRAMVDYSEAIRLRPDFAEAFAMRGEVYASYQYHGRDGAKALADYDAALNLKLGYTGAREDRAWLYIAMGRFEDAIRDYQFDEAMAHRKLAGCDRRILKEDELEPFLAECKRWTGLIMGGSVALFYLDGRAYAYLRLGEYDKAIKDYNAVLAANPRVASSLYGRGIAKLRSDDTAGGSADIEAAKTVDPRIAEEFARYGVTP